MADHSENRQFLEKSFNKLGLDLNELQLRQFIRYAELLTEWNEKINLTSITDPEGIVLKHFADSCAPVLFSETESILHDGALLDVGSGAGFPGVPLAILYPELPVTLLDSLAKRIRFLETITVELGLKNVRCRHARAEDAARDLQFREAFSVVCARAVAPLAVLAEYCLPFVKTGGHLLAYKSGEIREECEAAQRALKLLGAGRDRTFPFTLPGTDFGRSLILIEKSAPTPKKYPRKAGTAAKNPL